MMMMMVSLSEHAKQPLSLPLPPKVFFHLSSTSLTLCSSLFFQLLVNIVSPLHYHSLPQFLSICLSFLILSFPAFLSFGFSLSLVQTPPTPPILLDIGIVIVLWSCGLTIYLGPCRDVLYKVLWTHQLVFILLVPILCFWQCGPSHSFTAIGSEPNQENGFQTNSLYTHTQKTSFQEDKSCVAFVSKLESSVFVLNTVYWICGILIGPQAGEMLQSNKVIHR